MTKYIINGKVGRLVTERGWCDKADWRELKEMRCKCRGKATNEKVKEIAYDILRHTSMDKFPDKMPVRGVWEHIATTVWQECAMTREQVDTPKQNKKHNDMKLLGSY